MEVLLVLGILGVIMAMVVPKVLGRQKHASIDATRISIGGLSQALKLYSLDHGGDFPSATAGLEVLLKKPASQDPAWKGEILSPDATEMGFAWQQDRSGLIWWVMNVGRGSAAGPDVNF